MERGAKDVIEIHFELAMKRSKEVRLEMRDAQRS